MKYGNFCNQNRTNINIGDYLQFLAISRLYKQMGIPDCDICYIGQRDAIYYQGEKLILPINTSVHLFVKEGKIAISPDIIPVFLGIVITTTENDSDIDAFLQDKYNHSYFLSHSPIGCRDETTYDYFTRHDIPAYINGCLTATFPKIHKLQGESVIFTNAPKDLLQWVPGSILRSNIIFTTQQHYFNEEDIQDYHKIFHFVQSSYDFFAQNAKLVVTSRLHVALPCTAYGIPVILAKDIFDTRFSFIERYLPIYNRDQYKDIDWYPKAPDIEPLKERLVNLAISRIETAMEIAKATDFITREFKTRNRQVAYENSHSSLHKTGYRFNEYAHAHWESKKGPIPYALWGVKADTVEYWRRHIESQYPNAKLSVIFDRYKQGELLGVPIQNPDVLADMQVLFIVVCAVSASDDALSLFRRLKISEDRFVIAADRFISQADLL